MSFSVAYGDYYPPTHVGDIPPYGWWQYPTYQIGNPTGWECPRCHATYNPVIMQCYNCQGEKPEEENA